MTSERRIAANRANAQKSTGPKTPEGKANAAQNARRHGFRAKSLMPSHANEVRRLVELLRSEDPQLSFEVASAWAEAVIRKEAIQRAKEELVEAALAKIDPSLPEDHRRDLARLGVLKQLHPLSLYEGVIDGTVRNRTRALIKPMRRA